MSDIKKTTPNHENSPKRNNIIGSNAFKLLTKEKQTIVYLVIYGESDRFNLGRVIGDGYVPNVVHELRHRYSFEIPMRRYDYINKEEKPTWKGIYSLSPEDRKRAGEYVGGLIQ